LPSSVLIVRVKILANENQSLAKSIQNALKLLFSCDRNIFSRAFTANNRRQIGIARAQDDRRRSAKA